MDQAGFAAGMPVHAGRGHARDGAMHGMGPVRRTRLVRPERMRKTEPSFGTRPFCTLWRCSIGSEPNGLHDLQDRPGADGTSHGTFGGKSGNRGSRAAICPLCAVCVNFLRGERRNGMMGTAKKKMKEWQHEHSCIRN